ILPSPTTGTMPAQSFFDWKSKTNSGDGGRIDDYEDDNFFSSSDFTFQTQNMVRF
ncbi:hypothetical protein M569_08997, partial [Genlisea aurea]